MNINYEKSTLQLRAHIYMPTLISFHSNHVKYEQENKLSFLNSRQPSSSCEKMCEFYNFNKILHHFLHFI